MVNDEDISINKPSVEVGYKLLKIIVRWIRNYFELQNNGIIWLVSALYFAYYFFFLFLVHIKLHSIFV